MKAPAFQFYPADFIMGTASMIPEEVGGYIRLLAHQWTGEGLPNNRKKLEGLSGISGESLDTVLEKFRLDEDGRLKNDRLEKVRSEQLEYRKKQQENGKKGGNPAFKKGSSNPYYNPPDNPKDNPPDMPDHNPKINPSSLPSSLPSSSSLTNSNPLASSVLLEKEPKPLSLFEDENLKPEALPAEPKKPKEKSSAKKEKVKDWLPDLKMPFASEAFAAKWAEYRESKKKPYTTQIIEQRVLDKLTQFNEAFSIYQIDRAMEAGWTGLIFPQTIDDFRRFITSQNNDAGINTNQRQYAGKSQRAFDDFDPSEVARALAS